MFYPLDLQEGDGGAIPNASNYPDLLPDISRYYYPLGIFYFGFLVLYRDSCMTEI